MRAAKLGTLAERSAKPASTSARFEDVRFPVTVTSAFNASCRITSTGIAAARDGIAAVNVGRWWNRRRGGRTKLRNRRPIYS
jgi:hypothetical protein